MLLTNSQNNIERSAIDASLNHSSYDLLASNGSVRSFDKILGPVLAYCAADNLIYYVGYENYPRDASESTETTIRENITNIDLEDSSSAGHGVSKFGNVFISPKSHHNSDFKGSARFNGEGDYLEISKGSTLEIFDSLHNPDRYNSRWGSDLKNQAGWTVEFWVKPLDLDDKYAYQTLFSIGAEDRDGHHGYNEVASQFEISIGASGGDWTKGKVYVKGYSDSGHFDHLNDPSPLKMTSTTALSENTWYHIAVVQDWLNNKTYLFINGTLEFTQPNWKPRKDKLAGNPQAQLSLESGGWLRELNIGRQNILISEPYPIWMDDKVLPPENLNGGNSYGYGYFDGYINELRVSSVARYGLNNEMSPGDVSNPFTPSIVQFEANKAEEVEADNLDNVQLLVQSNRGDAGGSALVYDKSRNKSELIHGGVTGDNDVKHVELALPWNWPEHHRRWLTGSALIDGESVDAPLEDKFGVKNRFSFRGGMSKVEIDILKGDSFGDPFSNVTSSYWNDKVCILGVQPDWEALDAGGDVDGSAKGGWWLNLNSRGYLNLEVFPKCDFKTSGSKPAGDRTSNAGYYDVPQYWKNKGNLEYVYEDQAGTSPMTQSFAGWLAGDCRWLREPGVRNYGWNAAENLLSRDFWNYPALHYTDPARFFPNGDLTTPGPYLPSPGAKWKELWEGSNSRIDEDSAKFNTLMSVNHVFGWKSHLSKGYHPEAYIAEIIDDRNIGATSSGATNVGGVTMSASERRWLFDPYHWIYEKLGDNALPHYEGKKIILHDMWNIQPRSGDLVYYKDGYDPHQRKDKHYLARILRPTICRDPRFNNEDWKVAKGRLAENVLEAGNYNNHGHEYAHRGWTNEMETSSHGYHQHKVIITNASWYIANNTINDLWLYVRGSTNSGALSLEHAGGRHWEGRVNQIAADIIIAKEYAETESDSHGSKTCTWYYDNYDAPEKAQWIQNHSWSNNPGLRYLGHKSDIGYGPAHPTQVGNKKFTDLDDCSFFPPSRMQAFPMHSKGYQTAETSGHLMSWDKLKDGPHKITITFEYGMEARTPCLIRMFIDGEYQGKLATSYQIAGTHGLAENVKGGPEYFIFESWEDPRGGESQMYGRWAEDTVAASRYTVNEEGAKSINKRGDGWESGGPLRVFNFKAKDGTSHVPNGMYWNNLMWSSVSYGPIRNRRTNPEGLHPARSFNYLTHDMDKWGPGGSEVDENTWWRKDWKLRRPEDAKCSSISGDFYLEAFDYEKGLTSDGNMIMNSIDRTKAANFTQSYMMNRRVPTVAEQILDTKLLLHFNADSETITETTTETTGDGNFGLCTFNPLNLQTKKIYDFKIKTPKDETLTINNATATPSGDTITDAHYDFETLSQYRSKSASNEEFKDKDTGETVKLNSNARYYNMPRDIIYNAFDNNLYISYCSLKQVYCHWNVNASDLEGGYTGSKGYSNHRFMSDLTFPIFKYNLETRKVTSVDDSGWSDHFSGTSANGGRGARWTNSPVKAGYGVKLDMPATFNNEYFTTPELIHYFITSMTVNPRNGEVLINNSTEVNRKSHWVSKGFGSPYNALVQYGYGWGSGEFYNFSGSLTDVNWPAIETDKLTTYGDVEFPFSSADNWRGKNIMPGSIWLAASPSNSNFAHAHKVAMSRGAFGVMNNFPGAWLYSSIQHGELGTIPDSNDFESNNCMYFNGIDNADTSAEGVNGSYPKKMLYCPANNGYYTATNDESCDIKFTVPSDEPSPNSNGGYGAWGEFPITNSALAGAQNYWLGREPGIKLWGNGSLLSNVNPQDYMIQDGIYIPSQEKILYLIHSKNGQKSYLVYYHICSPHLDPVGEGQLIDVRTAPEVAPTVTTVLAATCSHDAWEDTSQLKEIDTAVESLIYCPSDDKIYILGSKSILKINCGDLTVVKKYPAPTTNWDADQGGKNYIPIYSPVNDTIFYMSNGPKRTSFLFEPNY